MVATRVKRLLVSGDVPFVHDNFPLPVGAWYLKYRSTIVETDSLGQISNEKFIF